MWKGQGAEMKKLENIGPDLNGKTSFDKTEEKRPHCWAWPKLLIRTNRENKLKWDESVGSAHIKDGPGLG